MPHTIIIIDDVHPVLIQELENSGFVCDYKPEITREEILKIISTYTGLIVRSKTKIDREILDTGKTLKFIGRYGAGMENIDTAHAKEKGIICLNAPEGNRNAVAEHTIGLLFGLLNRICIANTQVKSGIWDRNGNWGQEIKGKTIGIIGYGNTGSTFAKKLQGFDVRILAYDKYKSGFGNQLVKEATLDEIFEQADVVSLHIPLTTETNNMVNRQFIEKFRKPFLLLNTSRGQVVNTKDLVTALENKKIIATGLDVLEYEKLNFESMFSGKNETLQLLTQFDNVLLTPHIAGWTHQSYKKLAKALAEKIIATQK